MEITATPRRPVRQSLLLRTLAVMAAFLLIGLLLPSVLGLQQHVITRDADGTYARGSLVFDEPVAVEQLARGDVILDRFAGADGSEVSARTVLDLDARHYVSGPNRASHRWPDGRQHRVVFGVPLLGYAVLLPITVLVPVGLVLALALAAGWWRRTRRDRIEDAASASLAGHPSVSAVST